MTRPAIRTATPADVPALAALIARAIATLQAGFLTPAQIAASHAVMGLDTQLVRDGTYLLVEVDGAPAGCGGWSRRATLYGGDHSHALRDAAILDPAHAPARIRAMYTHPDHVRRGIGRLVLARCERDAAAAGYRTAELMATLSGEPLYRMAGYAEVERVFSDVDGVGVPLIRMRKGLAMGDVVVG